MKLRVEEKQRCAVDELTQSQRQASAQDEPPVGPLASCVLRPCGSVTLDPHPAAGAAFPS